MIFIYFKILYLDITQTTYSNLKRKKHNNYLYFI